MKKIISLILVAVMVFSLMPLTLFEVSSATSSGTIEIGAANLLTSASDIIAWASTDATKTVETMYNSSFSGITGGTFHWWYKALLVYDNTKGVYTVSAVDKMDGSYYNWKLGNGRVVLVGHDSNTSESFTNLKNLSVGDSLQLSVAYDSIVDNSSALYGGTFFIPASNNGIVYSLSADGKYYIVSDYIGTQSAVSIPSKYNGLPVKKIGEAGFGGCTSLSNIVIPDSVTMIDERIFSGCSSLSAITVDEGNAVYHSAGNCIIETESKTLIAGCKNSVIPSDGSVTTIGDCAFYNCGSLASIVIPDSVTTIGYSGFYYCDGLANIIISDSVTTIGDYAFSNCDSLTSIIIPDSVKTIGSCAFTMCYNLTTIVIPDSVTTIGGYAFKNCDSLKNAIIGDSVKTIDSWTFFACESLASVVIGDSVTTIGDSAFYGCDSLTSIEIPNSVTTIGESAFSNCDSLTSIEIPNSVTTIGDSAFSSSGLTSINIPASVTTIGVCAFDSCSALERITVASGNTVYHSAGNCLIETSSRTLIKGCKNSVIPSNGSVTKIGFSSFEDCRSLTSIQIPNTVNTIDSRAFVRTGLQSLQIPDSVTWIGGSVFMDCSNLQEVIIPKSVTLIGTYAFMGCSNLENIYCGATSKPSDWTDLWNSNCSATVHWGYISTPQTPNVNVTLNGKNINVTSANLYQNTSGIIAWATSDSTKTVETLYNASFSGTIGGTFHWWYKALLVYDSSTGVYTVEAVDKMDGSYYNWKLGSGRIVLIGHDTNTSSNFTNLKNLAVGDTLQLNTSVSALQDVSSAVSGVAFNGVIVNQNGGGSSGDDSSGEANPTEEELEQQIIAMFADAEFEDVEVEGPKVEALGYEFPLFSLKAGWKLSIWEGFGKRDIVHIDYSGNKVKVVIGVKPRNIEDAKDEEYWTKTYREIKSLYHSETLGI